MIEKSAMRSYYASVERLSTGYEPHTSMTGRITVAFLSRRVAVQLTEIAAWCRTHCVPFVETRHFAIARNLADAGTHA